MGILLPQFPECWVAEVSYHYTDGLVQYPRGPRGPDREVTKDTGREKSGKNQSPLNPGNLVLGAWAFLMGL